MKHILILTLLLFSIFCYGQDPVSGGLQFEKMNYDFGEIDEGNGPAEITFNFVNSSNDTLMISGVRASCGCTTPGWTKESITPGDSGFVTASYNPYNRPGPFNKSLRVQISDGQTHLLYIKGVVKPRPRTIADELPTQMGGMRLKYRSLNLGRITTEKVVTKTFEVYNDSDSLISFLDDGIYPVHVKIKFEPDSLPPREKGAIIVSYDPAINTELGFNSDLLVLRTSDYLLPTKRFPVVATVEEYFPPMTDEELEKAPRLLFDKTAFDFGGIADENLQTEFVLKNEGKTSLNIRSVKSNCQCVKTELDNEDIEVGSTAIMKVTFLPQKRRGRQYKTITVFSNDPRAPTQVLSIKANVNK